MTYRPHSSTTLIEGMKDVQYESPKPTADRKRELQMQIEAPRAVMFYIDALLIDLLQPTCFDPAHMSVKLQVRQFHFCTHVNEGVKEPTSSPSSQDEQPGDPRCS